MFPFEIPKHYSIEILGDHFKLQCSYQQPLSLAISLQDYKSMRIFQKSYFHRQKVQGKLSVVDTFFMFLSKQDYEQIKAQNKGKESRKITEVIKEISLGKPFQRQFCTMCIEQAGNIQIINHQGQEMKLFLFSSLGSSLRMSEPIYSCSQCEKHQKQIISLKQQKESLQQLNEKYLREIQSLKASGQNNKLFNYSHNNAGFSGSIFGAPSFRRNSGSLFSNDSILKEPGKSIFSNMSKPIEDQVLIDQQENDDGQPLPAIDTADPKLSHSHFEYSKSEETLFRGKCPKLKKDNCDLMHEMRISIEKFKQNHNNILYIFHHFKMLYFVGSIIKGCTQAHTFGEGNFNVKLKNIVTEGKNKQKIMTSFKLQFETSDQADSFVKAVQGESTYFGLDSI